MKLKQLFVAIGFGLFFEENCKICWWNFKKIFFCFINDVIIWVTWTNFKFSVKHVGVSSPFDKANATFFNWLHTIEQFEENSWNYPILKLHLQLFKEKDSLPRFEVCWSIYLFFDEIKNIWWIYSGRKLLIGSRWTPWNNFHTSCFNTDS